MSPQNGENPQDAHRVYRTQAEEVVVSTVALSLLLLGSSVISYCRLNTSAGSMLNGIRNMLIERTMFCIIDINIFRLFLMGSFRVISSQY